MQMPSWIREAVDGYRWLWRAQLRWARGPRWLACIEFTARVVDDLGRGALAALRALATSRPGLAPAPVTIEGRTNMAIPHPAPAVFDDSANERLKAAFDSLFWTSLLAAVVIHFATFAFWPKMTVIDISSGGEGPTILVPPPPIPIPPAPERLDKPALPIATTVDVDPDLTIGSTDWDQNPVARLSPPPRESALQAATPKRFFPFTVKPEVLNSSEVVRAMQREYPAVLRDAGIGGRVDVIFSIDEEGRVIDTALGGSSGYQALDAAALAVANVIRFSPALNRDRRVAVQVAFPIVFRVEGGQ